MKVAPGIAPGQTLGFLGAVGGKPGNQQQNDASGVSESHKKHRRALFKTGAFNHSATHPHYVDQILRAREAAEQSVFDARLTPGSLRLGSKGPHPKLGGVGRA